MTAGGSVASYLFIVWAARRDTMMDRMAIGPALKTLSLVGRTATERVVSGVSAIQERLGSLWKQPSPMARPGLG